MIEASIAVQPPATVQTRKSLYPNVIGKMTVEPADPSVYYFAMAVLLDSQGKPLTNGLCGITTINGAYLNESGSPNKETIVFPFFDASVSVLGRFRVRLDIYKVLYGQPEGANMVTQIETELFGVSDSSVPPTRPNSEERMLIRQLRDAGITPSSAVVA